MHAKWSHAKESATNRRVRQHHDREKKLTGKARQERRADQEVIFRHRMCNARRCAYRQKLYRYLDLYFPPTTELLLLHHLGRQHEPTAHNHSTARKGLRAIVPASTGTDDGPRDRRARQRREADDGEDHAHPGARLPQVRRQAAQPRGEERLDAAGGDAEEDGPRVQPRRAGHGDPGELADARDDRCGHEDVDGAPAVREVVGHQAADDADAVEEEEEVE